MILELLAGYWAFQPFAEEVDNFVCEHDEMYNEIEELKYEIEILKNQR